MKTIKIKNIVLVGVFFTFLFSACVDGFKVGNDFLDKAPGVDVTKDSIFGKAEYARQFLWNTYRGLYYGIPVTSSSSMFEVLSDVFNCHASAGFANKLYYSGSYNASMEDESPSLTRFSYTNEGIWTTIRKGWLFIENVDNVPDMDEDEKLRLKAEAKLIIATRYFDAFRHFGGLPLVTKSYDLNDDMQTPRATIEETKDFMINLLNEAIPDLPWVLDADEYKNWDGRMTSAAAMGLKCKILLFAASPLFNDDEPYCTEEPQEAVQKHHVWTGGYKQSLWDECLIACEEFFEENKKNGNIYHLLLPTGNSVKDYRNAFRSAYFTRGSGYENPEMLLSTRYVYQYTGDWSASYYFPQACYYGVYTPTQEFVEMFPMKDGTPFDWNSKDHREKMFKETERDPRLFETIAVNQCSYAGRKLELWIGGRDAKTTPITQTNQWATGYGLYKFILDRVSARKRPLVWPYLRMAEIHLIYAEALMKANRFDDAIAQIDLVRARVGLKSLTQFHDNTYLHNQENLMKEILRERTCELGMEDVRFFDLIRNKLKENFTTPLHGLRTYRNDCFVIPVEYKDGDTRFRKESDDSYVVDPNGEYIYVGKSWSDLPADEKGPEPNSFSYEKFELTRETRFLWKEGNFSPKWYLSAFPPSEINKNYGLTQNPGW